ncbi:MAG: hypothetical protein MI724_19620, partial [Spirochaetales bacterium]|nr:hypothetical protein [Spirochaetales bacterium]
MAVPDGFKVQAAGMLSAAAIANSGALWIVGLYVRMGFAHVFTPDWAAMAALVLWTVFLKNNLTNFFFI